MAWLSRRNAGGCPALTNAGTLSSPGAEGAGAPGRGLCRASEAGVGAFSAQLCPAPATLTACDVEGSVKPCFCADV